MTKILVSILVFVLIENVFIQTELITVNENDDITSSLTRLHEEVDKIRRRLNPIPDLITFASDDVADRLKRHVHMKALDEEPDTVYINMKIDSGEDVEPKYVNLYVDTKRDVNVRNTNLNELSDYIDSKVVYLKINPAVDTKPNPSYRHFERRRRRHH